MADNIKDCFISRYGDDGVIMEADFSQLEVIHLAHLTKCPRLISDIQSGMDMHTVRAAELFDKPESQVEKGERKVAKVLSFSLQYGAGAKSMAATWNVDVELTTKFIENYYGRYPEIREWQTQQQERVEANKKVTTERTKKGHQKSKSVIGTETGRRYTFWEYDAPKFMVDRGKLTGFNPPEIKNYQVQGGATGDIVPMALGDVYLWLLDQGLEEAKLVNTVHDSIILDVPRRLAYTIASGVKEIMESSPELYENYFDVEYTLPLKVEVTCGPSWNNQPYEWVDHEGSYKFVDKDGKQLEIGTK